MFKNKGDPKDPDNFRPITLVSCLGKLFTCILNKRLTFYSDELGLLKENQTGFRKGYSTMDNVFSMHALISLYFSFGKKLFCSFIDLKKAFDKVWRAGLWKKMLEEGINGKCFKVIYNMYQNIKSCVRYKNENSDFFPCLSGVRQGENLSPFLFAIFLNDLESFLKSLEGIPLELIKEKCQNNISAFVEIFVLLYADDTVILAESKEVLQKNLDIFGMYCEHWKLTVNHAKSKVIIFSKRKSRNMPHFYLQGNEIEIVDDYMYLGVIFNYNGSFKKAKTKLIDQARRSMFAVYKRIRNNSIPIDIQLKLFDSIVEPILLYGSEVWGFEGSSEIEKIHLQFCKNILKVRQTTPNYMVYGELGRSPLSIKIKLRMISFWNRLLSNENKLSTKLYKLLHTLHDGGVIDHKWVRHIKTIFDEAGLSYIFDLQGNLSLVCIKTY